MANDSKLNQGDRVRHIRLGTIGVVTAVAPDNVLLVRQDNGMIFNWSCFDVEKLDDE